MALIRKYISLNKMFYLTFANFGLFRNCNKSLVKYISVKAEFSPSGCSDYNSFTLHENFVTLKEEQLLVGEVNKKLSRMKYEFDHWDAVIKGYREIEKNFWTPTAQVHIERLKSLVIQPAMAKVHILDLSEDGYIDPHIDSVKYCGESLAIISLLSDAVLKLEHEEQTDEWFKIVIPRYSMYILKGELRYKYKHSILTNAKSIVNGEKVSRTRRISIIARTQVAK